MNICIFIIFTIITQVGGLIYLFALLLNNFFKIRFRCQRLIVFIGLYFIATFLIIPVTAPIFGREKVKHTDMIKPATYMTVVLNRNYVRPALNNLLAEASKEIQGTNIQIAYLVDANFPFINKFPLLPHLSHNDGKKIDLSFIYEDQNGKLSTKQKSMSGYGVFENPKPNELNQVKNCLNRGFIQYDYPKYFTFGTINSDLLFSEKGTKKLIKAILKSPQLGKIFIEPHII